MKLLPLNPLRRHRADRSDGFTLIELLVVVAIIAILTSIALGELMRLELPDRWTDVFTPPCVLPGRSGVANGYYSRWLAAQTQSGKKRPTTQYQAAECLYLIVNSGLEDNTLGTDNAILAD